MRFLGDADDFIDGDFVVGGDVLIGDMTSQLVADGAKSLFGDAFNFAFSFCISAFFADAHFESHVITLLLFVLLYSMDTLFDFLDKRMIADDTVHIIKQGAGSFGKTGTVSLRRDKDELAFVWQDERGICCACVTESIDSTFFIK